MIKKMKKLTWLLVLVLCILVLCISLILTFIPVDKSTPSTWYVATTGSDNATGDISHPFKTIQKAVDLAVTGETIYIRGGTYNERVEMKRSGTAGNPITIAGYPGETVTLDGTGISLGVGEGLIHLYTYKYITIQNLVIQDSVQQGIGTKYAQGLSPTNNITIYDCTFINITYRAINFWQDDSTQISDILVSHCSFSDIQTSHSSGECVTFVRCKDSTFEYNTMTKIHKIGVCFATDCTNCLIDHNKVDVTDIEERAAGIYLDGGQYNGAKCSYMTISNNFIYGNRQCIGFCNEKGSTTTMDNITIVNNVVYATGVYPGINQFNNYGVATNYYNITIKYNTVYTTDGGECIEIDSTDSYIHNLVIANNILVGGTGTTYEVSCGFSSTNPQFKRENNLYYSTSGIASTRFNGVSGGFESSAVSNKNPLFVSISTDFHLTSSSPAIDAASSTYTISYDYDDNPRPQGAQYDIGAYEY